MKTYRRKRCADCQIEFQPTSGAQQRCVVCGRLRRAERARIANRARRERDPERFKRQARERYSTHREHERRRSKSRLPEVRAYRKERYARDPVYRLRILLRNRLGRAVQNGQKAGSAVRDLGCSIAALKRHLESKFQPGMTWENWGPLGWHVDHVQPLSQFDLTDRTQFLEAYHYTNLQPLWAVDNLQKSGAKGTT